jgi:hypothetical protein
MPKLHTPRIPPLAKVVPESLHASVEEVITRFLGNLHDRVGGPMSLRLILQPTIAALFAIRAGLQDARTGRPPYFRAILTDPMHRGDLLREGWKAITKVFVMAVVIDAIYQFVQLGWFYPGEALTVAFTLACIPYLLIRGPVGRLARLSRQRSRT